MDASSFASNFFYICISVKMIENINYKLHCFGADIDGPAEVLCNNKSVVTN